jgi:hypothetical protein
MQVPTILQMAISSCGRTSQSCVKYHMKLLLWCYHVWSWALTDTIMPFQILHFFEVLSLAKMQVEVVPKWGVLE